MRWLTNSAGKTCGLVFESVLGPSVWLNVTNGATSEPPIWKRVPSPTASPPTL